MENYSTNLGLDIEAIASKCKRIWLVGRRKRLTIQERVAASVPWWLIIIATGLFALSAAHTAGVFSQLSPVGYAGPFVVEFTLLWAAFSRVGIGRPSKSLRLLEVLAFCIALLANGLGATARLALLANVSTFSFDGLIHQFPSLPIGTQGAMLFVVPFALFIPVGTLVAGEALADLFLKQRRMGGQFEEEWAQVEREELRRAIYAELIRRQRNPAEAGKESSALASKYTSRQGVSGVPILIQGVPSVPSAFQLPARNSVEQLPSGKVLEVVNWLTEHDPDDELSVRNIAGTLGTSVGTVQRAKAYRARKSQ